MTMFYFLAVSLLFIGAECQAPGGSSTIPMVAFTEGQTTHLNLTHGETVVFNKYITKVNAQISGGVFTAAVQGLYSFHFYSLTRQNEKLLLDVMMNGKAVCSLYAYTPSPYGYADAGNSVMLYLRVGDHVSLKAHESFQTALYGASDEIYTTFTGVLLDAGFFESEGFDRTRPVGFSVGLQTNLTINDGGKVAYDVDFTNNATRAGYNFTSHDFKAPYEGLYVFHFHALSLADKEVYLELFKNDAYVMAGYAYAPNELGDAGNTAILHLKQNDHVTIKARPNTDVELIGAPDRIYATFSGALLSMTVPGQGHSGGFQEVAFSVGLTHDLNLTAYSKVIYDRLNTNFGNGFDMRTGVFTAKTSGVYMFHFHGLSETGEELYLELYKNYEYIASAYAYDANSYAYGSNAVALDLISGDQVYVGVQSQAVLYGAPDEVYCTFSGYLVAPVSQYQPVVG